MTDHKKAIREALPVEIAPPVESTEGPGLPILARLYQSGRYLRASTDRNHHGKPLTELHAAAEWRQKAALRWTLIEELQAALQASRERVRVLEANEQAWLAANSPGGWIDNMRKGLRAIINAPGGGPGKRIATLALGDAAIEASQAPASQGGGVE